MPWEPSRACKCAYCQARDWDYPVQQPGEMFNPVTFPGLNNPLVNAMPDVVKAPTQELNAELLLEQTATDINSKYEPKPEPGPAYRDITTTKLGKPVTEESVLNDEVCDVIGCGFHGNGKTRQARLSSVLYHRRREHAEVVAAEKEAQEARAAEAAVVAEQAVIDAETPATA